MKENLLILFLLTALPLFSQKEGEIWYFGENAGMSFNSVKPVALTDGTLNTSEGCASICDSNGMLLFYTDGTKVWNRSHQLMPNGNGLNGNPSTTQSAIIVQCPSTNSKYYVFTVDKEAGPNGLNYSEIDMDLQGGSGDVTSKKNIPILTPICEKVTAIKHGNNIDWWIVTHLHNSNTFNCFLLNSSGISSTPILSSVGNVLTNHPLSTIGYLKASLDGSKIAIANTHEGNVEVFDFDKNTGKLSNPLNLNHLPKGVYGIEFSPNSKLLYASENGNYIELFQYNLLAGSDSAVVNSKIKVGNTRGHGALQIAPDGRIYQARGGSAYLGVIKYPNKRGLSCNFVSDGFWLNGKKSILGLPNFPNATFDFKKDITAVNLCFEDSTLFGFLSNYLVDSVLWIFDDPLTGVYNISNETQPSHMFSKPGVYNVRLITYSESIIDTTFKLITINSIPLIDLGSDVNLCFSKATTLDASLTNATYLWQNNSTMSSIEVSTPGKYWVTVNVNNCIATDTIYVFKDSCEVRLKLPNVFTPNADGANDLFIPIESYGIASMNTSIYSRWGNLVFKSSNGEIEWDGGNLSEGTYFWIIHYLNYDNIPHTLNGTVTIAR